MAIEKEIRVTEEKTFYCDKVDDVIEAVRELLSELKTNRRIEISLNIDNLDQNKMDGYAVYLSPNTSYA